MLERILFAHFRSTSNRRFAFFPIFPSYRNSQESVKKNTESIIPIPKTLGLPFLIARKRKIEEEKIRTRSSPLKHWAGASTTNILSFFHYMVIAAEPHSVPPIQKTHPKKHKLKSSKDRSFCRPTP